MELIYSANRLHPSKPKTCDTRSVCSLSPRNLVAFTSTAPFRSHDQDDDESHHKVFKKIKRSTTDNNHLVYVCDIDKPWQASLVCSQSHPLFALQWHVSGTEILVATEMGEISVWQMKDHLSNQWQCSEQVSLEGEEIVAIDWLHQGTQVHFKADEKESPLYSDKIIKSPFKPTLSRFGGKPLNGCIAITATGLVCVSLCKTSATEEPSIHKSSLSSSRSRIMVADLAFVSSGHVLAVTSDGKISSAIRCFQISISCDNAGTISVESKVMSGFFSKSHLDPVLRDCTTASITHVRYMSSEDSSAVMVGAGNANSSHVELWHHKAESVHLHRFFQAQSQSSNTSFTANTWCHQSSIAHASLPTSLAVPRFPVAPPTSHDPHQTRLFQYVAIAYRDGSIKLVDKHTFQPMTTTNLDLGIPDMSEKHGLRMTTYMSHMRQSHTGCVLMGLDQFGCLYVMKAVNTRDPVTQVNLGHLVNMLEYCIITGHDWWDILSALKPGLMEGVIQRLSDDFTKQPSITQESHYQHFMALKSSLLRCSTGGQHRAADCHARLLLHAISGLCKSMLRPKNVALQEQSGVAEKLAVSVSKTSELDIDSMLVNLSPMQKEFVIEPATLQTLQHLTQWLGDISLYLLTTLPLTHSSYTTFPGMTLLKDPSFLSTLRELLILIRVWGFLSPNCVPQFTATSTKFDCLAHIYKLITRVWLSIKAGAGVEFEESLLDECCLLQNQVMVPPVDEGLFGDMNYGACIFTQAHPVKFIFGETPLYAKKNQQSPQVLLPDGQTSSLQRKDIVNLTFMGQQPSLSCRACSRCGCLSLLKPAPTKSCGMRAWELRFAKLCPCGGSWRVAN